MSIPLRSRALANMPYLSRIKCVSCVVKCFCACSHPCLQPEVPSAFATSSNLILGVLVSLSHIALFVVCYAYYTCTPTVRYPYPLQIVSLLVPCTHHCIASSISFRILVPFTWTIFSMYHFPRCMCRGSSPRKYSSVCIN
ncbi:hypothetical protein CPB85DRAFT_387372 [Mucidula mucida]|nr:hypothetical protein CPB85DRAFT_387372 [Mucidula mucida]